MRGDTEERRLELAARALDLLQPQGPITAPQTETTAIGGRNLRLPEVADRLGVSVATVKRLVRAGYLEPVKIGFATTFREEDVERLRKEGTGEVRMS